MIEIEDFITQYLWLTRHIESPTRYLLWGAISALSAALRDNIWFATEYRASRLYPNIFVLILSGESASTRKSNPLDLNSALFREVSDVPITKMIEGAGTMQGILKTLGNDGSREPKGGSGYLLFKELRAGLILDEMSIGYLTDLYDYHPFYKKHLVSYDLPPIKNLCVSLIGATNEVMAQKILNVEAKEGGLLGRCFVIHETKRRLKDSGFEYHEEYPSDEDWEPMRRYIRKLQQIKDCPMYLSKEARDCYIDWYKGFEPEKYRTKTGFEDRLATAILKLCMIFSAAKPSFFEYKRGDKKYIMLPEMKKSIEECISLIPTYANLTEGTGIDPQSPAIILICRQLERAERYHLSRMVLLSNLRGNVSGKVLDEVMGDMEASGLALCKNKDGIPGWQLTDRYFQKKIVEIKSKKVFGAGE